MPQTQHPYLYGLNNPTRYTDPSGEFVSLWGGAFTGAAIGALIGGVSGGVNYALQHGQPLSCMLRDPGFWNAVGIGLAAGFVSGFIAGFFAPLHLLSSGFWTTVQISGLIGGISALYSQITTNVLTGRPFLEGGGLATLIGAISGGVMGGVGYNLQKWYHSKFSYQLSEYLEYKALRAQGYNAQEAYRLMQDFRAGVNPDNGFAFHFTNPRAAISIVNEGRLRASASGLGGPGVYAGTTPTPSPALKHAPVVGWGLSPGATVRIPIELHLLSDAHRLLLPLHSIVIRGDVWLVK